MTATETRPVELTEAETRVLTKVTAAAYRGSAYSLDRAERAALRRASIKVQSAAEAFPFRVAP